MKLARFGLLVCAIGWTACRAPLPPGSAIGLPLDPRDPRALEAFAAVVQRSGAPSALRGSARLSIDSPELRITRPQRLVAQQPAKLRVEVLALFGQVAGVVATDGVEFAYVDVLSGRRERGPVDEALLWRTARVDLTPSETVDLLLGAPGLDPTSTIVAAHTYEDGGVGLRLHGVDAPRERWLEIDAQGRLRRLELREPDGSRVWIARYGDWRGTGQGARSFAHAIDFEFPRVSASAAIRFDAVELDPVLSPEVFVLQVPPGG